MQSYTSLLTGAFALILLIALDWGIRFKVCLGLSIDYEEADWWKLPRAFPNRRVFQIAKVALAAAFIASFVVTVTAGASEHLGLAATSFVFLGMFGLASFLSSARAFRHFASHNLRPRDTGGYRKQ